METPAINMVEIVDLSPSEALLPILECVSNSIISLDQTTLPLNQRTIDVKIVRGAAKAQGDLYGEIRPIKDVVVEDNGWLYGIQLRVIQNTSFKQTQT
jgi:hypothetical protein